MAIWAATLRPSLARAIYTKIYAHTGKIEGHIHRGTCIGRDMHTERHFHKETCTRKDIHMEAYAHRIEQRKTWRDMHTERYAHEETCTRRDIYGGICKRIDMLMERYADRRICKKRHFT